MWSIEGVMNVLPILADLQGSVCSWHDCVEYEQQSVQARSAYSALDEMGAFVIVPVCLVIVCKMCRRVHHVTSPQVNTRSCRIL
jgi:hypothetical protein